MRSALALALFLALTACGGGGDSGGADAAAGDAAAGDPGRTDVTFETGDGKTLTGYLVAGEASPPDSPGVLLIHQFQQSDEQWGDLPEALAGEGYRVLAFNLRGHGDSDPYDGQLLDLLTDADAAPADRDAALAHLTGPGEADPQRIGIVGTSIGANLTVAAAIEEQATTYVSLSSRQVRAEGYAGGSTVDGASSVFYLAASNDGSAAADAQSMFDVTGEPRQLQIYDGTSDHGIAILRNQSDARGLVLDWLADTL